MKQLVIRLKTDNPGQCEWAWLDNDGGIFPGEGSLADIAAEGLDGIRVVLLFPAEDVLLTRVTLPPASRKQLLAAVPFAIEESLAADIEEQHFAISETDESGSLVVAVVAKERMDFWLGLCRENGVELAAAYPDILALPFAEKKQAMLLAENTLKVRTGQLEGFVLDKDSLPLLPDMEGLDKEGGIILYQAGKSSNLPESFVEQLAERRYLSSPIVHLLAGGLDQDHSINLLKGEYRPKALWERHWRQWRFPAGMVLLLLLVYTLFGYWQNHQLGVYADKMDGAIERIYRQSFPQAQRIVNPRVQMEQQLRSLSGEGPVLSERNFVHLLDLAAPILMDKSGMRLRGMRYRSGELDIDFEISNLQALDLLNERLNSAGLAVEIRNATARGQHVVARMQLRER